MFASFLYFLPSPPQFILFWSVHLAVHRFYSWLCAQFSLLVELWRVYGDLSIESRWIRQINALPTVLSLAFPFILTLKIWSIICPDFIILFFFSQLGHAHHWMLPGTVEDALLLPLPRLCACEAMLQLLLKHHERLFGQPRRPWLWMEQFHRWVSHWGMGLLGR